LLTNGVAIRKFSEKHIFSPVMAEAIRRTVRWALTQNTMNLLQYCL